MDDLDFVSLREVWVSSLVQLASIRQMSEQVSLSVVALRHVGSSFPDQGSNLCPLQWKVDY